jgi:aspartate dehydrogenase
MTIRTQRVALIGFGSIGQVIARELLAHEGGPRVEAVLVRPGHVDETRRLLPQPIGIVTDLPGLLRHQPDLVVECAGQEAVRTYAAGVLEAGMRLMVVSTGALATPGFLDDLLARADSASQLLIPAGAIAGLDGLGALKRAGLTSVTYTSSKPPLAWKDTPAEQVVRLDEIKERTLFFEGSAREAALNYPKNANLAATVALAGLGFERTTVRLVADPTAEGNTGTIHAESVIGTMTVVMAGRAGANPKTSASTAYSLVHAIQMQGALLVI